MGPKNYSSEKRSQNSAHRGSGCQYALPTHIVWHKFHYNTKVTSLRILSVSRSSRPSLVGIVQSSPSDVWKSASGLRSTETSTLIPSTAVKTKETHLPLNYYYYWPCNHQLYLHKLSNIFFHHLPG